jgi:hypothetical protein
MKKIAQLLAVFVYMNPMSAQNINFGMKGGLLSSKFKFYWTQDVADNSRTDMRFIYNVFAEGRVYKHLYLGVEVGHCSYTGFIDIKYRDLGGVAGSPTYDAQVAYFGWYQQEQHYFTINPQIKLGKSEWVSIGGGFGVFNNYINSFLNGYRTFSSSSSFHRSDLDGHSMYLPHTVTGGFLNLTLKPRIKDHIGLLFEGRYIFNSSTRSGQITQVKPSLRLNSFSLMFGLSFHL